MSSTATTPAQSPNRSFLSDRTTKGTLLRNDDEAEKRERRTSQALDRRKSLLEEARVQAVFGNKASPRSINVVVPENKKSEFLRSMTDEEITRQYEEWMKIAADGKINTANTWTLNLIDYFHDISVLREGESINFQKASCTLEGCVRIYATRVDSVDSETKILLSGLMQRERNNFKLMAIIKESRLAPKDKLSDGSDSEHEENPRLLKRKSIRSEQTLAKDVNLINAKKLDLEFTVDPLFKKTSADFDEGGAKSLLLNHLGTHAKLQLIFDASDVTGKYDEKDDGDVDYGDFDKGSLDAKELREMLCPSITDLNNNFFICNPLREYSLSASQDMDLSLLRQAMEDDPLPPVDQNFAEENLDDFLYPEQSQFVINQHAASIDEGHNTAIFPQYSHEEYVMSMVNNQDSLFSYFDQALRKNWAGPEHWKLQKVIPVPTEGGVRKKEKEAFSINFESAPELNEDELFQEPKISINLSKQQAVNNQYRKLLLPRDYGYNTRDLFSLFCKPNVMITGKKVKRVDLNNNVTERDIANASQLPELEDGQFELQDEGNDTTMQFQPEIADDIGTLNILEALDQDEIEFGQEIFSQGGRRIKPLLMNYAKVATRVDVRKLKLNMWDVLSENRDDESNAKLSNVMQNVLEKYSEDKKRDISVPFCFISLLHLANEHHFEIKSTEDMGDLIVEKC